MTANYECQLCIEGYYLYEVSTEFQPCRKCQKEAICYGGSIVAPLPSYWRSTKYSENFIECPRTAACLGGSRE